MDSESGMGDPAMGMGKKNFPRRWDWLKISLQYTIFDKFNGSGSNYDGFGNNASDDNTFYLVFVLII